MAQKSNIVGDIQIAILVVLAMMLLKAGADVQYARRTCAPEPPAISRH